MEESRRTLLAYIAGISCISGLMFGYDSSVISGASLYLYQDLGYDTNTVKEVVVCIILLGTVLGALG